MDLSPDPYLDYNRRLTAEGGIVITYKDIDSRFRHTLRRLFLWSCATGYEAWLLFVRAPGHPIWLKLGLLIAVAIVNWLIVRRPVEIYRTVEIRPDCMIIDGTDLFWLRNMEGAWPAFRPDDKGNQVLCGIYGTRFVEYLTARRFDDLDRSAEVLAGHLKNAMQQLWLRSH